MLVFLTDKMMRPSIQKSINIFDMVPVSMAIAPGKMYSMGLDTIAVQGFKRRWGSNELFGMIYHVPDHPFYLRKLDAFYNCSQSALLRNHKRDLNHRVEIMATPIFPKTLEELATNKYSLNEPVKCWAYMVNTDLPAVKRRLIKNHIIKPGCNVEAVKEAFQFLK
jgi:hypothetical protein